MKNWLIRLVILGMACWCVSCAAAEPLPAYEYTWKGTKAVSSYQSDTLSYSIERVKYDRTYVYITKVWMADPGRQIHKTSGEWRKSLAGPKEMMKSQDAYVLGINGSGYISSVYPTLEEDYPGVPSDYYFTSLGSLAVTDGSLLRELEGVPFFGLTLEADGLHMWNGAENSAVLAGNPSQTWCFWRKCTLIENGADVLDRENWTFAQARAARTILAKVDANNYLIMSVVRDSGSGHGMTLISCVDFLMENFQLEWAYNLDGGPSSALMYRTAAGKTVKIAMGAETKVFDMMGFTE